LALILRPLLLSSVSSIKSTKGPPFPIAVLIKLTRVLDKPEAEKPSRKIIFPASGVFKAA
jgi:hypothetical protein